MLSRSARPVLVEESRDCCKDRRRSSVFGVCESERMDVRMSSLAAKREEPEETEITRPRPEPFENRTKEKREKGKQIEKGVYWMKVLAWRETQHGSTENSPVFIQTGASRPPSNNLQVPNTETSSPCTTSNKHDQ